MAAARRLASLAEVVFALSMSQIARRVLGSALVVALSVAGCGGSVSEVPGSSGTSGTSGTSGGNSSGGGSSGTTTDAGTKPDASLTPVCTVDADCNGDPQISSLEGTCYQGICICRDGLHVQPGGKCKKTPPPECMASGGKCFQMPATCPTGTLEGSAGAAMSCGDLVAAVCCYTDTQCVGPDFTCCGPTDAGHAAICENGYRTCPDGYSPVPKGGRCG